MSNSVLIIGCGVIGLSTAVHFAEKYGYSVTAVDAHSIPSPWSAANDYNKIIRAEYTNLVYTKMACEAIEIWRNDPDYKDIYNECGRVMITPSTAKSRRVFEEKSIETLRKITGQGMKIEYFKGHEALAKKFDFLKYNSVPDDTEIKWNPETALGHAANSLKVLHNKALKMGVKFVFGPAGEIVSIKTENSGQYAVAKNGRKYPSDFIVVCAGASSGYIIDLKQQQSATGLFVTHIELSDREYQLYKDIPIVFDGEMGYFFPPDPATKILKIALPGSGASNLVKDPFLGPDKSLPRYKQQNPEDTIPEFCAGQAKRLLGRYIPELAYHSIFDSKLCWIADTSDSNFIIDEVPTMKNVYVATGDSGHAFKFLPNIGKYVVARIEDTLSNELKDLWRWREDAEIFDATSCSWRVTTSALDLKDIKWIKENSSSKL